MTTLRLAAGEWEATLLPLLGGAVARLRRDGIDILRPTLDEPGGPLDTACFPLVPYANRIAFGRFRFGQRDIALPRNFGDHPHTLHGIGWQRPWTVVDVSKSAATLRLTHAGDDDWPWPFEAEQRFELYADGLRIALSLTAGDAAMPAGLGLHPYFPAPPGTRLRTALVGAWLADDTQLPTERVGGDRFGAWSEGDTVARETLVDHCHDGWSGEAQIELPDRRITLSAIGADYLHLYLPPDKSFLCVEPVSHVPDAVNHAGRGMVVLDPHQRLTLEMRISA